MIDTVTGGKDVAAAYVSAEFYLTYCSVYVYYITEYIIQIINTGASRSEF